METEGRVRVLLSIEVISLVIGGTVGERAASEEAEEESEDKRAEEDEM